MHGPEILVPITLFGGLFLMLFGMRYLENKENMALIERGLDPRNKKRQFNPSQTLKNGLMFVGAGIGLFAAVVMTNFAFSGFSEGEKTGMYFALIAIFGGLGMLGAYLYERRNPPVSGEGS